MAEVVDVAEPSRLPDQQDTAVGGPWWTHFFRSLRHRDYRFLWLGQVVQSEGQWMEQVARGLLLWELSHDPFILGLYGMLRSAPAFFLALPAGVLSDRVNRIRLIQAAQLAACIMAFVFAILVQTELITVWMILLFGFANGAAEVMRQPARQALLSNLVPGEDIMNAVAMNEVAQYTMRIIGPVLAGAMIGPFGVAGVFYVRGALYLFAVVVTAMIRTPILAPRDRSRNAFQNMGDTFVYLKRTPLLLALVLLGVVPAMIGQPYQYLMPIFALEIFQVGAEGLGVLTAAAGVGALLGALLLAGLGNLRRMGMVLIGSLFTYGGALIFFGASPSLALGMSGLLVVGASQALFLAMRQTLVQLLVQDAFRGRVFSMVQLTRGTLSPVGALTAGGLASLYSAPVAIVTLGSIVLAIGIGSGLLLKSLRGLEYSGAIGQHTGVID